MGRAHDPSKPHNLVRCLSGVVAATSSCNVHLDDRRQLEPTDLFDVVGPHREPTFEATRRDRAQTDGAASRYQTAMNGSQTKQPNEEVGAKGMSGLPYQPWAMSQPLWSSQATPIAG